MWKHVETSRFRVTLGASLLHGYVSFLGRLSQKDYPATARDLQALLWCRAHMKGHTQRCRSISKAPKSNVLCLLSACFATYTMHSSVPQGNHCEETSTICGVIFRRKCETASDVS